MCRVRVAAGSTRMETPLADRREVLVREDAVQDDGVARRCGVAGYLVPGTQGMQGVWINFRL